MLCSKNGFCLLNLFLLLEFLPFSIRFYKAEVSRSFGGLEPLHRPMRQEEINPLGFIMLLGEVWTQHLSVYMAVL